MKKINLICIAVLVLVSQSIGRGEWWWPPSNVEISPQNPTCSDIITITLSGEWPDGCIPNDSIISMYDNNIYFDVICIYPPGTVCPGMITPWETIETLCPLLPGRYTVYARLLGYPGGEEFTQIAEFIVTGRIFSRIIYVDTDANGANDGSSWENAFVYLQDALAIASSNNEVWVAEGIYKPDQGVGIKPGDRMATFWPKRGVALIGGYAGSGQPDPNRRDVDKYKTVLSGDLNDNDGPGFTNYDENSYHVLSGGSHTECSCYVIIDGLTITGGNANGPEWEHKEGGGIYIYIDCYLTLVNCTIIGNRAETRGGGMSSVGSAGCPSTITNCRFIANTSDWEGGGLCLNGESIPDMTNCLFAGNSAMFGGAIYNAEGYPNIRNCTFTGNIAWSECGGADDGGGGIDFRNCIFWGNSDSTGNGESAQIHPCLEFVPINYCCIQGWTGAWGGIGNFGADPCFAQPGYLDPNGTPDDANDDFWVDGDYHLKSQAGRWDANSAIWVKDDVTSLCIDAGDAESPIGLEPFPNGGIINMGAYGGTKEASKSYFGKPPCETIVAGDINGDCKIDYQDLFFLSLNWLADNRQQ